MASPVLRRALLYVPSSSPKFLQKSLTLGSVDCVAYDLEDSVTPSAKPSARTALRKFLDDPASASSSSSNGIRERAVRINSVDSGFALDDLTAILGAKNVDTIVVPKVNSASDLHFVGDVVRHLMPQVQENAGGQAKVQPPQIIALIESAKSIMNLSSICTAFSSQQDPLSLTGLIFAAEDFAADLSITRTASLQEFLFARSAIVTAAVANNIPSIIDLVCTAYKGSQGLSTLEEECLSGKRLGFNGKQLIHPTQVEVAQRCFAPDDKEVEYSVRLLVADAKAVERNRGAWTLDGKMIDAPVVKKAERVVKRAELCGVDVGALRTKWEGEEPQ